MRRIVARAAAERALVVFTVVSHAHREILRRLCDEHAVESVDDAIELLTGTPAGEPEPGGGFRAGSINARVEARLASFAESARSFDAAVAPAHHGRNAG